MGIVTQITNQIVSFTGIFNIWLILSVFLLFVFNEFGLFIPYLVETVWLMIGYHTFGGSISAFHVILLWIIAILGRTTGVIIFYRLIRLSSPWITMLYHRHFNTDLTSKIKNNNILRLRILKRINIFSPYTVAFGRLIGLKIPFSITLSLHKRIKNMILALILSSIIHDSIYICLGVVGSTIKLPSILIILYSLLALAIIYGVSFIIRFLLRTPENKMPL